MDKQAHPGIARERHFGHRDVLCYTNRPASLVHAIRDSILKHPQADAVVDGDRRISFAELDQRSFALASHLINAGIKPGDRVALVLANRLEFVVSMVAVLRLGAIVVPVNVRDSTAGFTHILSNCEAVAVIVEASSSAALPNAEAVPSVLLRVVVSDDPNEDEFTALCTSGDESLGESIWFEPEEEDPAILLYTSGTTGAPKGAVLTHINVVHTALHYTDFWKLGEFERTVLAVPASHVTGTVAIIITNLMNYGCTIMMRRFDAAAYVRLAIDERQSWTILVPAMYNLCLLDGGLSQSGLDAWRVGGFGGAPMPSATVESLAEALPDLQLLNAYGSTECSSVVVATPPGHSETSLRSVGTVVPCCEMRVVVDGKDVPVGEPGEVWLRGPNTVPGYWNNEAKTRDSFVDGYWRSGDIGALDEYGYLILHDRIDDVINRGGYKIYGVEVENLLIGHDEIVEAAVIGIDDAVLGQGIHAIVVASSDSLTEQVVRQFCKDHLASYKTPDRVTFRNEPLPRNPNGKILKRDLREV